MGALSDFRYRLALRADYDAEWAGEVATWVWSRVAIGPARAAARALHACERANRIQLGEELKSAGSPFPMRNPFVIGPAIAGGLLAAVTPMRVHRVVYTSKAAAKGLERAYRSRARRFAPRADDLYASLTERHLNAFSSFKAQKL